MFENNNNEETIRWPANLDRAAILERLARVSELASQAGLTAIAARFAGVRNMPTGEIATNVVGALTELVSVAEAERPKYEEITRQLEMVALNLRNLK
ncbi:MAG TPA: hypothetical protein VIV54_19450 [Burkholderiales bacterium]